MTTKVQIACPEASHWPIRVTVESVSMVMPDRTAHSEPVEGVPQFTVADTHILLQGDVIELYVHSGQRLVIDETEPTS